MSAYEIACIVVCILIIIVTIANVIVWLLRKRKPTVVQEVVETQPEQPIEEPIEESAEEVDIISVMESGIVEESDSGAVVHSADDTIIYIRYNKSFKAKLIQARDEVREYYNTLKNHVLSYKGVKTGISWKQESVRYGKAKICWFVLRGKSLYLYLPLNPDDYAESKYKVERAEEKRYAELPCLYKLTNSRRVKYATQLIDMVMEQFDVERTDRADRDYIANYPYEDTLSLIKRKLIKVTRSANPISAKK